jgi:regulator of protease activity HflC (stomatin/prohibitin superfamily)
MKARALIDRAPFGPETVKAIGEAFDQASARIKRIFDDDPNAAEVARIRLARAILSVATEGNTDVRDLKNRAIVEMANRYSRA